MSSADVFSLTVQLAYVIIISVNIKWSTAEVKTIIIPVSLRQLDCISDKPLSQQPIRWQEPTHYMLHTYTGELIASLIEL